MMEPYKLPRTGERKKRSPGQIIRRGALAGLIALVPTTPLSVAEAKPHKKSVVEHKADKIEQRIQNEQLVTYDATRTIYWSRKNSLIENEFRTRVPLTERVDGVMRFFRTKRTNTTLSGIDVIPLPRRSTAAESEYAPFHHCGATPSKRGVVSLSGAGEYPSVNLTFSPDEPQELNSSIRVRIGKTEPYGKEGILIPPALDDERIC